MSESVFQPKNCVVPTVEPIAVRPILESMDIPIAPDAILDCPDVSIPIPTNGFCPNGIIATTTNDVTIIADCTAQTASVEIVQLGPCSWRFDFTALLSQC